MIPQQIAGKAAEVIPRVNLSPDAEESSYFVARVIMKVVYYLLDLFGLEHHGTLFVWVYSFFVFVVSIAVGYVCKWIILLVVRSVGRHLKSVWYGNLTQRHFFSRTTRVIPAIVFIILIKFTLYMSPTLSIWLTRITWCYVIFVVTSSCCIVADVAWAHIDMRENTRKLPLKGIVQLIKGIVWIIATIIVVAIIVDRSPTSLLAGLGAFAAVLMLVFKDSILGVVAGVQLSENDSLHVGDWIKVQGTDANGTVLEVSLTQVKVLNWDKTVTTLPPYNLVSGSFTNYRSMQESHTRRIQRCYNIDADSVVPTDELMLDAYSRIPLLAGWIAAKRRQREEGKTQDAGNPAGLADGSIETNLGVFRAYLKIWLDANPDIDHASTCFVSTLTQSSAGIPLQVYCFTNTSVWTVYEAIQSSIFEHIAVMLYRFNLYTFENPSGRDTLLDGYMSPGKNPDVLFGLPFPFFNSSGSPQNPAYPVQQSASEQPSAMQNGLGLGDAPEANPYVARNKGHQGAAPAAPAPAASAADGGNAKEASSGKPGPDAKPAPDNQSGKPQAK